MFEDPSAITKGWQENPVNFDTVFNQSNHVWSWGSPDILPMFAKGAWNGQVHVDMYDSAQENFFADQDISELDSWVFNKVKQFFKKQVGNEDLRRSDKVCTTPKVARVAKMKKSPTNSDFKICYGGIKLIINCKKQKNSQSHFGDSS